MNLGDPARPPEGIWDSPSPEAPCHTPAPEAVDSTTADVLTEAAMAAGGSRQTIELYRPIKVNGQELKQISLDSDRVGFTDMENIEMEFAAKGMVVPKNPAYSATYCVYIAARAAAININDLGGLNCKDYSRLVTAAQNFLLT